MASSKVERLLELCKSWSRGEVWDQIANAAEMARLAREVAEAVIEKNEANKALAAELHKGPPYAEAYRAANKRCAEAAKAYAALFGEAE